MRGRRVPGEVSRAIGARLRAVREARGLSIPRAAERCGLTPAALGSYERGQRSVLALVVVEIAEGYRVHPGVLLADDPLPAALVEQVVEAAAGLTVLMEQAVTALAVPDGGDGS